LICAHYPLPFEFSANVKDELHNEKRINIMYGMNESERNLLSTDLLRTFLAIVDSGNLTIAAARLHRTQSAISVQLRKLEADLGVQLFTRTSKGMMLTEAGTKLLPNARSILRDIR
jgi:hypothetical protein